MLHELKTWPEYFEEVKSGKKRFELRKDDRGFKVGHHLMLMEYEPKSGAYTGRSLLVKVMYLKRDVPFGLMVGYCIMSIKLESGK